GPHFLPDGRHLFVGGATAFVATIENGVVKELPGIAGSVVPAPPAHILFAQQGTLYAQRFDFQKLELDGEPQPIARGMSLGAIPAVSASVSGVMVYRRAADAASSQFVWFDRSGRLLGPVA